MIIKMTMRLVTDIKPIRQSVKTRVHNYDDDDGDDDNDGETVDDDDDDEEKYDYAASE